MVQRYMVNPDPDSADALFEEPDGQWVRYHDYAALEAKLDALLVELQVENTALLKTKVPEYFSKLAECIADDSQNKYAEIAALEAEVERLRGDIRVMVQKAADKHLDGYRELGKMAAEAEIKLDVAKAENKRLRTAAQAIVAAADKRDTDEVYRNMRVLRAALAGKEE